MSLLPVKLALVGWVMFEALQVRHFLSRVFHFLQHSPVFPIHQRKSYTYEFPAGKREVFPFPLSLHYWKSFSFWIEPKEID